MRLYFVGWCLWIVGTGLIVLSWMRAVSPTTGWIGFAIAGVGFVFTWAPRGQTIEGIYPTSPQGNPVEPTGIWVTPETVLEPGTRVLAQSQGQWWRARVIAVEPDGRVRVNYVGWDPNLEESHRRSQLQLDADVLHDSQVQSSPETSIRPAKNEYEN
ncbi:MAG: hypothetical protein L0Y70_04825 [Gemmataceae bacterium]|nr:hypothetical protein [Gemmataceae bacterium]